MLDYQSSGSYSKRPHYAARTAYFEAVHRAGGLPMALPYLDAALDDYLKLCDGLVTPGGEYRFPEDWYGGPPSPEADMPPRARFEIALTRAALDGDVPILGICAGMQVMAGVLGGTFYEDVRIDPGTLIDHLDEKPAEEVAHDVRITAGTLLHRIVGGETMGVNTAHKEALKSLPEGLAINAVAPDGVIEGIEIPGKRFALGVQWHPEFFLDDGSPHLALFRALVDAARG